MILPLKELSADPVPGVAYKSNLSSYKGSVYGGSEYGVFNGFKTIDNWFYEYNPSDGSLSVWKELDDSVKYEVFTGIDGLKEVSFTFDKSMLNVVTYIDEHNRCFLYFFDSLTQKYIKEEIPQAKYPKVALNSIHPSHVADSDVILGYVKDDKKLCIRQQKERYTVEHTIKEFNNKIKLYNIGYADTNRFQYEVLESTA